MPIISSWNDAMKSYAINIAGVDALRIFSIGASDLSAWMEQGREGILYNQQSSA